ncbi:N6-adenine-specific DNA methylase [Thermosulfidibacter takaii ABI70S6]|uniref:N6-adenine-specific DNA methylase n=1 Tax=Thermosulfidibacter takaii (strain DSM 17441 / JCM 13301 / NBRC 103674 / ABI70S6) TaxID=1298851 RepID=A0A0S3QRE5_THET7|nr:THUMP domain-containing protein [Thermosulfidibacter takaii]BAT70908.1 N6-adenine-specific DNA methylase [Thermosulfidibacter takaii ABI70S6]
MVCDHKQDERGDCLKVLFSTERGIEELLALSIKGAVDKIPVPFNFQGRVLCYFQDEKAILENLYTNPLYHKASLLLLITAIPMDRNALDTVYEEVFNSSIDQLLSPSTTFGVRCVRKGFHPFYSQEVAAYAGAAVIDACRVRRGFRPRVNLKDPDLIVNADVVNDTLLLGIELVGLEGMHHRHWRKYSHPAGLKSTLASALLMLANFEAHHVLWDPMCGSGTIPIEAAHRAINFPPAFFRKDEFSFLRTGVLSEQIWHEVVNEENNQIRWNYTPKIFASDVSPKHLEGAKLNASSALVEGKIIFYHCDFREFPHKDEVDIIVTNPPYGVRLANPQKAEKVLQSLLETFCKSYASYLVVIHPDRDKVLSKAQSHSLTLDKAVHAYNGNLKVWLLKLSKNP